MGFEYLPDVAIADIAFRANGKNLDELFENCALATTDTMMDPKTIKQNMIKEVSIENDDIENLLVDFLSEIIYFKDAEHLFFSKFEVKIDGSKLHAKMHGSKLNDDMDFRNDVKAITMHMLKVEKKDQYYATVVVDI